MREPERTPEPAPRPQPQREPIPSHLTPFSEVSPGDQAGPVARRRTILGGLQAVVGVGGLGYLLKGQSTLPDPAGQFVGPEYRAATLAAQPAPQKVPPPVEVGWTSCVEGQAAQKLSDLDLVLVIDTTGSMGGVINDVKANVASLLANLQGGTGTVRVGIVAYRDYGDAYVVRPFPLTSIKEPAGLAGINAFVAGLEAAGGGDWPEAMAQALDAAASMSWRGDVPASVIVIADAPPHPDEASNAASIAGDFRGKIPGSQISLVDTGSGGHATMRAIPKAGGGQYVTYDGHILNSLYSAISGCTEN